MAYEAEPYWSRVAEEIRKRERQSHVAGDDNPYYRYKRRKFLRRFLNRIDVASKVVLEVGCGPGGNLIHVARRHPTKIVAVDISTPMLELASESVKGYENLVDLRKTDGKVLPLLDQEVDISFTVTVLQHTTDPIIFQKVVGEICRVTGHTAIAIEDTGDQILTDASSSFVDRPVRIYEEEFRKHGFRLHEVKYLGLRVSQAARDVIVRHLVPSAHKEGEPFGRLATAALILALVFTRALDDIFVGRRDLTKMVFVRQA